MTNAPITFVYLPGAGGGGQGDLAALVNCLEDDIRFEMISYPGWQRYLEGDFTVDVLIEGFAAQIAETIPAGPIRLMGMSIGGHFGYAAALRLEAMGREVAGFCAVDSFMIETSQPTAGWQRRAMLHGWDLLRKRRFAEIAGFVRSKAWRALLRLAGGRLAAPLRKLSGSGRLNSMLAADAIAEQELAMRLMIREVPPWMAELDREPTALMVPAYLFRTQLTAADDVAWRRRCPKIKICEVPGTHQTLFEAEHIVPLRMAFAEAVRDFRASSAIPSVK